MNTTTTTTLLKTTVSSSTSSVDDEELGAEKNDAMRTIGGNRQNDLTIHQAAMEPCSACDKDSSQPLTVFAKHLVRPADVDKFEAWCREITELCSKYEGYLGSELIRPVSCDKNEYVSIFRYNNYENLRRWMNSDDRKRMIAKTNEFADRSVQISYHSLEYWFVPPSGISDSQNSSPSPQQQEKGAAGGPPPKYKMVFVTTRVVFSQLFWVPAVLNMIAPNLHWVLAQFLSVLIIVILATYILFPILTRLLAFWLFPDANYATKLKELIPAWLVSSDKNGSSSQDDQDSKNDETGSEAIKVNLHAEETARTSLAGEQRSSDDMAV
eukprot:CAMPEP_0119546350 /NCGR_PEP_ID=MMETSP1352-20130426/815_1 /TAXON_ID=265584 /ORGANISM="Stauroneis constricta, Strain CCMP1120" /LENGTH=324 /DNA_ID=CAMNT_0007591047 /DNA_START=75 /DNA_END=1049 /DNA_ORIENTATION=-